MLAVEVVAWVAFPDRLYVLGAAPSRRPRVNSAAYARVVPALRISGSGSGRSGWCVCCSASWRFKPVRVGVSRLGRTHRQMDMPGLDA